MNKISYTSGGMAFFVDILQFLVSGIGDSFKGILTNWGSPVGCFVVSGCVVTITGPTGGYYTYTWTPGYIAYNGEILPVAAGSITNVPISMPSVHGVYWTYAESVANNQATRVGVLIYGANTDVNHSGTLPLMPWNALTLDSLLLSKITSQDQGWQNVSSFLNSWGNAGTISINGFSIVTEPIAYRKDLFGVVWIKGIAQNASTSNTNAIFQLPVGYRPANDRIFFGSISSASGTPPIIIKVGADGNVFLLTANMTAYLDGISFKL